MITISQAVERVLNKKPFIVEALNDHILNFSSLAKFLKPDVEELLKKKVNEGAIVMSLRRFDSSDKLKLTQKLNLLMKKLGDIVIRSNLVDFTFKNSETLLIKQQKLLEIIIDKRDFFYTISQGVNETTFVMSDNIRDKLTEIFEGEKLISYSYNLSSITIKLPEENIRQPGLYYYIFRALAWDGINILEVISTSNEFTLILRDEDIDKAFSAIKQMKN